MATARFSPKTSPRTEWTVSSTVLSVAVWVADAAGDRAVVDAALRAVGLRRRQLEDRKATIRLAQEVDFFEEMAERTGDGLYGLRSGLNFEPKGTNLNSYILFASRTLREALRTAARFAPLERGAADFRLEERPGGTARVALDTLDAYERRHRQSTEFHVAMVLRYLRAATCADFPLEAATFAHRRTEGIDEAEALMGCPLEFGARSSALVFAAEALALPIPTQDDALCALLVDHGELLLRQRGAQRPDLVARVEREVLDHLPRGGVHMTVLAGELGMSERTLTRRLAGHGLTLRGLTEELRRELSLSYLSDPGLTLGQIAFLLGYSEASAFSSAFRRWFGEPPGRRRDELLGRKNGASRVGTGRAGGPEGMAS